MFFEHVFDYYGLLVDVAQVLLGWFKVHDLLL